MTPLTLPSWAELKALLSGWERSKIEAKRELLLDQGSQRQRERKREHLAFDIAAIANTRGGDGYLVIGMVVGPFGLGIIASEMVEQLAYVNDVALVLIALSAGGELRLGALRQRIRSIGVITTFQIVFMFFAVAAAVFFTRGTIDFLEGQPTTSALAVAILFGLVAVAKSPATTIAVITEERARGIESIRILSVSVIPF